MLVEIHILQNFAPSNLNRDDTGSPKDCEFGGHRRARISSQCFKRAIRTHFQTTKSLPLEALGTRTKRLVDEAAKRLAERGRDAAEARAKAVAALAALNLKTDKEGQTEYLIFLSEHEIEAFVEKCDASWDDIPVPDPNAGQKSQKKAAALPDQLKETFSAVLDHGHGAADVALFGRMLADRPNQSVDAACQVAHAISTNRLSVDFDYFTAVDDLQPGDSQGAAMIGTVEFNSACFYRYANVDVGQLRDNLQDDVALTTKVIEAFLRSSIAAVPSGKQNSMAAQNPPSFVLAVVREHGLWSLANAFLQPVSPTTDADLVDRSVAALDTYWGQLIEMYGAGGIVNTSVSSLNGAGLEHLKGSRALGVDALIAKTMEAVG